MGSGGPKPGLGALSGVWGPQWGLGVHNGVWGGAQRSGVRVWGPSERAGSWGLSRSQGLLIF